MSTLKLIKGQESRILFDGTGKVVKEKDMKKFVDYLSTCTNSILKLSNMQLGNKGITAIASAICENEKITEVDVSSNGITPEGILNFLHAMMPNTTLVKVSFAENVVGDALENILEMVKTTHPHVRFDLTSTSLKEEDLFLYESTLNYLHSKRDLEAYVASIRSEDTEINLTFLSVVAEEEIERFINSMQKVDKLLSLEFNVDGFTTEAIQILEENVYTRNDVRKFKLVHNFEFKETENGLFNLISKFPELTDFEIVARTDIKSGEYLLDQLSKLKSLKKCTLNEVTLSKKMMENISVFNTADFSLSLINNMIDPEEDPQEMVCTLGNSISVIPNISLISWDFYKEIFSSFSMLLQSLSVTELDLSYTTMSSEEIAGFMDSVSKSTVQSLVFAYNRVSNTDATHFAELLESPALTSLKLDGNDLSMGMLQLRNALVKNSTLKSLYVVDTNLGKEGIELLCQGISQNTALEELSLRSNIIDVGSLKRLLGVLGESNCGITSIDLSNCGISYAGARFIEQFLKKREKKTLKRMQLYGNVLDTSILNFLT